VSLSFDGRSAEGFHESLLSTRNSPRFDKYDYSRAKPAETSTAIESERYQAVNLYYIDSQSTLVRAQLGDEIYGIYLILCGQFQSLKTHHILIEI
jgi:hypothetical protein